MGFEIQGSDFSSFVTTVHAGKGVTGLPGMQQTKVITPRGDIHFKEQVLGENLSILEGHYRMDDDVRILGKGDTSLLEIQINLSCEDIFYHNKSKSEHVTAAKSANIMFLAAEDNEARILLQKDIEYHTFDIHLPVSLLDQYAGESKMLDRFLEHIHSERSTSLSPDKIHISPHIYHIIQDIKSCKYEGLTRKIYLESKALELVALLYDHAEHKHDCTAISPLDQERIHTAAMMIRENLEKPFTIIELARLVGVNQTKLKTGFKLLFGQTVFGYLQEIRMERAKKYLLDTTFSIQEIGMLLGYQNTSNFSAAFKNIHGYSPIRLREGQR